MCYLRKVFLILLVFMNFPAYCQDDENSFYAEVVVIEDSNLINTIDSLVMDNNCINKRADLYLDYRKNDYIILGQTDIRKYIATFKKDGVKVYMTFLNGNPFFIFSKKEKNLPIRKTNFKVDLSEFLDFYSFSIHDLSSWILKERDGKMEVIKEVLFSCN